MKIVDRIKFLWNLMDNYNDFKDYIESDLDSVECWLDKLQDQVGEMTTTHCDIHMKDESQVIVVGRYRNRDFVKAYTIKQKNFEEIVKILRSMEKNSKVGFIDMPSTMKFSSLYEHDRF